MRLTEAAAIPSWKVKCKFKDTDTKFRGKYESDNLNHSGSEWTEIETTLFKWEKSARRLMRKLPQKEISK